MNNHDDNDNDGDHFDRWYLTRPLFASSTDFSRVSLFKKFDTVNIEGSWQTNKNKEHSKL